MVYNVYFIIKVYTVPIQVQCVLSPIKVYHVQCILFALCTALYALYVFIRLLTVLETVNIYIRMYSEQCILYTVLYYKLYYVYYTKILNCRTIDPVIN